MFYDERDWTRGQNPPAPPTQRKVTMAKIKNSSVYSEDREYLQRLADELEFIGRNYVLDLKEGRLTQLALPPQKPAKKRPARSSRHESTTNRQTPRKTSPDA